MSNDYPTSEDYLRVRAALENCNWSRVPLKTKEILGEAVGLLWLASLTAAEIEEHKKEN